MAANDDWVLIDKDWHRRYPSGRVVQIIENAGFSNRKQCELLILGEQGWKSIEWVFRPKDDAVIRYLKAYADYVFGAGPPPADEGDKPWYLSAQVT